MKKEQQAMLEEIMALDFAALDLQLFLNTHPQDVQALMYFANLVAKENMLTCEYESKYGPLTANSAVRRAPWQWINSPWPWQYIGG